VSYSIVYTYCASVCNYIYKKNEYTDFAFATKMVCFDEFVLFWNVKTLILVILILVFIIEERLCAGHAWETSTIC